jgi:hypothetical protein
MLNIYNGSDRILRRYGTLDKSSRPDALGYTGMYTRDLGAEAERIEQFDASRIVGRDHSLANYQRDRWLRSRIQQFVFWLQPGEKSSESRTTKAANCRITAEGLARQSRQTHGASNRREPDHIEQGMSKAAGLSQKKRGSLCPSPCPPSACPPSACPPPHLVASDILGCCYDER